MTYGRVNRVLASGVGIVLVASWLSGQDPKAGSPVQEVALPRGKALGEVRSRDGKPWVGATVTLRSSSFPKDATLAEVDELSVTTDERGRFRAKILQGRAYSVWAYSKARDGQVRASQVADNVVPQTPVFLKEQKLRVSVQKVQFHGLDAWAHRKPFRFCLVDQTKNPKVLPLKVADDKTCELPLWFGGNASLQVFGTSAAGELPLFEERLTRARRKKGGPRSIRIPEPGKGGFGVLNIDTEKLIQGAEIHWRFGNKLYLVGKTDKDGYAELELPANVLRRGYGTFYASAKGRAVAAFQTGIGKNKVLKPVMKKAPRSRFHAHLGAGKTVKGRVFFKAGAPAANMVLLVNGSSMHYSTRNSRNLRDYSRVFRTDSDGRFELPNLLQEYPPDLHVILAATDIGALPKAWRGLHPVVMAPVVLADRMGASKPVDIVLGDLCPVELTIRTPEGIPAAGAAVTILTLKPRLGSAGQPAPLVPDRRGIIRLLLQGNARYGIRISSEKAFMLSCLETRSVAGSQDLARLTVRMTRPMLLKGKVVNDKGKPVRGARVRIYPQYGGIRGVAVEGEEEEPMSTAGNAARLVGIGVIPNIRNLMHSMVQSRNTKTDKEGRFQIPVPRLAMSYSLSANHSFLLRRRNANQRIQVNPEDPPDEIEIVLR